MVALSHKAKQYGWYALKVSLVFLAIVFIYRHIELEDGRTMQNLLLHLQWHQLPWAFFFLSLAALNWSLEARKWQVVISAIQAISFREAIQQSLGALTLSIATPNRIGEYGAKASYFPADIRKKIVFLNFVSNAAQMLVTVFFGILGALLLYPIIVGLIPLKYLLGVVISVLVMVAFIVLFNRKRNKNKPNLINKILKFQKALSSRIKTLTLTYSLLRYLVFSTHFYLLLHFFGAENTFLETMPFIWLMYLGASMIPMISFFDVVIKGGIAIWLFNFIGINEVIVLTSVFSMWVFNFAIPALFGTLRVLKFYPQ